MHLHSQFAGGHNYERTYLAFNAMIQNFMDQGQQEGGSFARASLGGGDNVFAGSMNQSRAIQVRINAVGSDTRVGRLMELVERGASEKPNAMRFADGIGRWFVPGVCIASLVTFLIWVRSDLSSAIDHSIASACSRSRSIPSN